MAGRRHLSPLDRLAALSERWSTTVRAEADRDAYRRLLHRSRVVLVGTRSDEVAYEATAAGALLFVPAEDFDGHALLVGGNNCVAHGETDLEDRLDYFLTHEEERRRLAEPARDKHTAVAFEQRWRDDRALVERHLPVLAERAQERLKRQGNSDRPVRLWRGVPVGEHGLAALRDVYADALRQRPRDPGLTNAYGVLAAAERTPPTWAAAANALQDAWAADLRHAVAGLNLAEALVALDQPEHSHEQCRRVLAILDAVGPLPPDALDAPPLASERGVFRVEWERAAWGNAGRPDAEVAAK